MRASYLSLLAILPLGLAAPIHTSANVQRNLSSIADGAAKLTNPNATAIGTAGAVNQSDPNPALTAARTQVVDGLGTTDKALKKVSAQAKETGNNGVQQLVTQAQSGLNAAKGGVKKISDALASGAKPSKADQKTVAQGIHDTETAIKGMDAAITKPNRKLSKNIAKAVTSVDSLNAGAQGVLAASNLTLADLGLPADFAN